MAANQLLDKDKYRRYCADPDTRVPLFSTAWWMDAVCGQDNWDVLLVEKGQKIVASLPYALRKKFGFRMILQPGLTQTNGIAIEYPGGQKQSSRLAYEKELMNDIIQQLEELNFDLYSQNFHPGVTNWQPFYWAGFHQTTRYTFRLKDLSDPDRIWLNFAKNNRNNIRKAERQVAVRTDLGLERFMEVNDMTFARQGTKSPYSHELVKRIDSACAAQQARRIFLAEDAQGRIHAGLYVVWDAHTMYALMAGYNRQLGYSRALNLLMWEAIQFAATFVDTFDFEGTMMEPVERFFRSFGATQTPYFHIYKMNLPVRIIMESKQAWKILTGEQAYPMI